MKMKIFLSLLILGFFSACNRKSGQDQAVPVLINGDQVYADSASSSVKVFDEKGRICIQQTSTAYEIVDAWDGLSRIPLLLKVTKIDLCFADSVNKDKVYQISARSIMDTRQISWETQFVATEINLRDNSNTILAVHEGTQGAEDLLTRFSLLDGKQVFQCSYGDLLVSVPNVKDKRFAGFTSRDAVTNPVKEAAIENLIGFIEYGSSKGKISAARLMLKRSPVSAKIPTYTPDIVWLPLNGNVNLIKDGKEAIMMKTDEKYTRADIRDISLQLTFYYGEDNEATQIVIPVVNDQLVLSQARFDKDIFELQ